MYYNALILKTGALTLNASIFSALKITEYNIKCTKSHIYIYDILVLQKMCQSTESAHCPSFGLCTRKLSIFKVYYVYEIQ